MQYPVLSTSSPNDSASIIGAYDDIFVEPTTGQRTPQGELNVAFSHWLAACELFARSASTTSGQ